ncbi:MAG: 4Fe-4S binding protein [Alphaproteobacteria bacterium]|nr:4Fe-4S binding protein [Alphaproteobacteria bacterium]
MPSVITDKCAKCLTCVEACPVGAIKEAATQAVVNPDECIDCGACISECPVGAIVTSDEADEKDVKFNAENSK